MANWIEIISEDGEQLDEFELADNHHTVALVSPDGSVEDHALLDADDLPAHVTHEQIIHGSLQG